MASAGGVSVDIRVADLCGRFRSSRATVDRHRTRIDDQQTRPNRQYRLPHFVRRLRRGSPHVRVAIQQADGGERLIGQHNGHVPRIPHRLGGTQHSWTQLPTKSLRAPLGNGRLAAARAASGERR